MLLLLICPGLIVSTDETVQLEMLEDVMGQKW